MTAKKSSEKKSSKKKEPATLDEETTLPEEVQPAAAEGNSSTEPVTSPQHCLVSGDGLRQARVRQQAQFTITVCDDKGQSLHKGGTRPVVAVRGGSMVKARVTDVGDGTYITTYKPSVSGKYSIAISLGGVSLPGSPFPLNVVNNSPCAERCELRGEALTSAAARTPVSFEVLFRDALGEIAVAEELDVYVETCTEEQKQTDHKAATSPSGIAPGADEAGTSSQAHEASDEKADGVEQRGSPSVSATVDSVGSPGKGSYSKTRVEVGGKPLVLRREYSTMSEQTGTLRPGQLMRVIEERTTVEGDLRARVVLETKDEGARMIAQSWVSLPKVGSDIHLSASVPLPARQGSSGSASIFSSSSTNTSTGGLSISSTSCDSIITTTSSEVDMPTAAAPAVSPAEEVDSPSELPKKKKKKKKTTRQGSAAQLIVKQSSFVSLSPLKASHEPSGWVTIVKGGQALVRKRVRLEAGQRQIHKQQWERRLADDKIISGSLGGLDSHGLPRSASKVLVQEKSADPTEVGFAFGGVHPGTLHAHGQLHEVHSCTYSVGMAGKYLLHVWLRNQALPMPSSPFDLVVHPGTAQAQATRLPAESLPLRGIVGTKKDKGCHVVLRAADIMGNVCKRGGATVACTCADERVKSECMDNDDGTYELVWRSTASDTYDIRVTINGEDIDDSPAKMQLISTHPDLSKTEADGNGLHQAVAGKPATFKLHFRDVYSNHATPSDALHVHIALVTESQKKALGMEEAIEAAGPSAVETRWVGEGDMEITYVVTTAGFNDLVVWCFTEGACEGKGDGGDSTVAGASKKFAVPGSPFGLAVTAGKGDVTNSEMEGFVREVAPDKLGGKHSVRLTKEYENDATMLVVGDTAIIRPKVFDQFGNPGVISESALSGFLKLPNGEEMLLSVTPQTRGGLTTYDVRYKPSVAGVHEAHVNLSGKPIKGSPVSFHVAPDYHEHAQCYLKPPEAEPLLTEETYTVTLQLCDRHGNPCTRSGGAVVNAKLGYIKQGVADGTSLTTSNHSLTVDDSKDGTYELSVYLGLGSSEKAPFPIGVTVEVNLDRDAKERPTGFQMPALSLFFQRNPDTKIEGGNQKLKAAGKQIVQANKVIKAMNGEPAPAPAPASALAPAPAPAPVQGAVVQ